MAPIILSSSASLKFTDDDILAKLSVPEKKNEMRKLNPVILITCVQIFS